jgi:hypothetical protein
MRRGRGKRTRKIRGGKTPPGTSAKRTTRISAKHKKQGLMNEPTLIPYEDISDYLNEDNLGKKYIYILTHKEKEKNNKYS